MTFQYPRRVKDLPNLEVDSEEEVNTPCQVASKQTDAVVNKLEISNRANKENESTNNASSSVLGSTTKNNSAFTNLRMYPKRSSELPILESDSEEEDNDKNDHFNCAILNDSFLVSPGKSLQDMVSASTTSAVQVEKEPPAESSFILRFDQMALGGAEDKEATKGKGKPTLSFLKAADNNVPKLAVSTQNTVPKTLQRANSDTAALQQQQKHKDLNTPFKTTITETVVDAATHSKTAEAHFVTPQIRSFSVKRRPRELCSTESRKTRLALVNEFRSQKVLFQTPMAMSRAPITNLSNDSLTLSLCDTINEIAVTPNTAEKSPLATAAEAVAGKSKKSLENAFNEAKNPNQPNEVAETVIKPTVVEASSSASNEAVTSSTAASAVRETTLQINNATYTILKKLGCGGSSSVYLARNKDSNKECALKVVDLQGDQTVVEGYMNETKLLAKLQGNMCVVALFDYQLLQKESKLYLVMEKGDSDLHKILQSYTTSLPLYVLMNYLYQMLQAVNYIHQNGVIHSDLKPANFLMVNGRLKLIDFGIASNIAIDSTSIIKFSQAGTFNYISPEALTDTSSGSSPMRNNQPKIKISTKSDVWSLGCILYLLLYKKTPYSHIKNIYAKISAISNPKHTIEYPPIPLYYPVMLVHIIKNCLQHNPKQRPSCAELLQYPFHMVIPIKSLTVPPQ